MPLRLFELLCLLVVALTLAVMARTRPWRPLLTEYAALALAGLIGEETCIVLYRFYAYAPQWDLRVHHVPLLVPLIWPLVVLSSRAVVQSLWPMAGSATAFLVAIAVTIDASLMEVIAVRANLWHWVEPGHLEVPIIGMLGWGYFALGANLVLDRKASPWWIVLVGPVVANVLIFMSWWVLFRWTLRGDLEPHTWVAVAASSALLTGLMLRRRARGLMLPPSVAVPRVIAASLFFALLATTALGEAAYWLHTAAVALPYLAATQYTLRESARA